MSDFIESPRNLASILSVESAYIPLDDEVDSTDESNRFALSFDLEVDDSDQIAEFYKEWGYVVIRNVFDTEECASTCDAMWNYAEASNPGLLRDDPRTWEAYQSTGKYGLSARGPVFDKILLQNRQNARMAQALSIVLQTPVDDVMVSHDRFTIYRATALQNSAYTYQELGEGEGELRQKEIGEEEEKGQSSSSEETREFGKKFITGRRNVHLDLNPWWYLEASNDILIGADSLAYVDPQDFIKENNLVVSNMGPHVQCVMNFADNVANDGGTIVVPKFHKYIDQFCEEYEKLRKPVPFLTFNEKRIQEKECEDLLLRHAHRVPMRAGSLLIWNQIVAHGTQPNTSTHNRLAQFVKAFSRQQVFTNLHASEEAMKRRDQSQLAPQKWEYQGMERLTRRAENLKRFLDDVKEKEKEKEKGEEEGEVISALGMSLFGLDVLSSQEKA